MKTIANRLSLCAASAVLFGASAWGQQTVVTANVPFAFNANGVSMPAGVYRINTETNHGGVAVLTVRNAQLKRSAMSIGYPLDVMNTPLAHPRIMFRCGDAGCDLSQVWMNQAGYAYPTHKSSAAHDRLTAVALTTSNGE